jgi:dTDP-4-amino-4,6-dideoxygalactose transaminase
MMHIPMSAPDITTLEIEAVNRVLRTPYLSIGPCIKEFEQEMSRFLGVGHAAGLCNGTAALHLAVIAAGVREGDEVITTPFSFIASANCVLYERAKPVFVDIDPDTLNIDARLIEPAITSRTRAILPVHAFGQPADMDPILKIATDHGLYVIEDACEAIGAEYKGRKAGTLGDAAAFAFYPNKQMTTGEGGMVVTDREQWAALFRSLRNQGRDIFDAWLNHSRLGYNYRLDEMSAALGMTQLRRIEELLSKRERVARMYNERLGQMAGVSIPYIADTTTRMSWFVYVIRLALGVDRNRVMAELENKGIPSRPYFTPIHLQPFYREHFGYCEGDFPVTDMVANRVLALPFSGVMTEDQVDRVCQGLKETL